MVEIKTQLPYVDEAGNVRNTLVKHWAEDENGVPYIMKQVETGAEYDVAIDVYPCPYTYVPTEKKANEPEEEVEEPVEEPQAETINPEIPQEV
jgi:hypothetical protein